ncbi:MAG TPA: GNAT family N-acetyltransferase [Anaerolineales bacterium]|nr:GNAT family N-acetyltransferase [Anaerolineales bacterium]
MFTLVTDWDKLLPLLSIAIGIPNDSGLQKIVAIERAKGTQYWAAQAGDEIIGLVGLWMDQQTHQLDAILPAEIMDVAVHPNQQGQGLGKQLVKFALQKAWDAGYRTVWLSTDGNDRKNLSFYIGLGFRIAATIPDWFGPGTVRAILRIDKPTQHE